jgi:hypothetical protein
VGLQVALGDQRRYDDQAPVAQAELVLVQALAADWIASSAKRSPTASANQAGT